MFNNARNPRKTYKKPDQNTLRSMFQYDPETGRLVWQVSRGNRYKGRLAGLANDNYVMVTVAGIQYNLRDLVWIMHYGDIPACGLKCLNGNKRDTRIENIAPRKSIVSFL